MCNAQHPHLRRRAESGMPGQAQVKWKLETRPPLLRDLDKQDKLRSMPSVSMNAGTTRVNTCRCVASVSCSVAEARE
jgi:hypothetical protein